MISVYFGQPVEHLSHFKRIHQAMNESIERLGGPAFTITVQPVYLVQKNRQLSVQEESTLFAFLERGEVKLEPNQSEVNDPTQLSMYVTPRLGTRSPWASKATDIAQSCHLDFIENIEHGLYWHVSLQEGSQGGDIRQWQDIIQASIYDPLLESIILSQHKLYELFNAAQPKPLHVVDIINLGIGELYNINQSMQLALSEEEIQYLFDAYQNLGKNPTDVELMMFSQVNSEHCRHKIFNATWSIDGVDKTRSLFSMIRHTHETSPKGTLVAYKDNASVIQGTHASRYMTNEQHEFVRVNENIHILTKVETHNHPTAISPFPGAATGSGGEIRDEGATGRGSKPKAGLTGYTVSNLRLPEHPRQWEQTESKPENICSPLKIMLEAPIGGASFNNEFGRPNLAGYFRTFEQDMTAVSSGSEGSITKRWGYHKPIMIAGGLGNIREQHVEKNVIPDGSKLVVLGGPAMLIGLGGGAASSVGSGQSSADLDFASVQRGNPEMQRRCQEVIDACWALDDQNPIVSIHDVGAGGLSNALPEIIHDADLGGSISLRDILSEDIGMSPMEIWCNEAQERYVLAINAASIAKFEAICQRERCLYSVVGEATKEQHLRLSDGLLNADSSAREPVDIPMDVLFGNPPKMHRQVVSEVFAKTAGFTESQHFDAAFIHQALRRVLTLPTVADKSFLITIGDRSVTGQVAQDQMVGPWQVPVADVAVTLASYQGNAGEAMAMGERTPLAIHNSAASARMAVAEAITNISAAKINDISDIKLSANWMAAADQTGQDAALYEAVEAIGLELCPEIGVSIPVGKDSMSMRSQWQDNSVVSPVSLVVSAFTPVSDVTKTLTPQLTASIDDNALLLIDLSGSANRLGASALEQVYNINSGDCADIVDGKLLKSFFECVQTLNEKDYIKAYHDRSDGGVITSLLEMCFASRCGMRIDLTSEQGNTPLSILFNEEIGAVLQISYSQKPQVDVILSQFGLQAHTHYLGSAIEGNQISVSYQGKAIIDDTRHALHRVWSQTSWQMQRLRDNPNCADQEYDKILNDNDSGLYSKLSFDLQNAQVPAVGINLNEKPKIAILREQGTNGHFEMANAFDMAGFTSVDVHMSDLAEGRFNLNDFQGMAACGGFSYGDVLGAGRGWANSILFNNQLRDMFQRFLSDTSKFSLGVCNGCQMLANLKSIIPGAQDWPSFEKNQSEQYEGRQILVEIGQSESVLLKDMQGSIIPLAIGHGEGRAVFENDINQSNVALRYISHDKLNPKATMTYPYNPNGSTEGITGLTNTDGRVTIMMPHPERVIRTINHSYMPDDWRSMTFSPWMKLFHNAREWIN